MLNQKCKHRNCAGRTEAEKRIEDIKAEIDRVLERLGQIEVDETSMKKRANQIS